MHVKSITLTNVKSFKDRVHVDFDSHFNLLIGPNGGGKSNLFDSISIVLRRYFLDSYTVVDYDREKALQSAIREKKFPLWINIWGWRTLLLVWK